MEQTEIEKCKELFEYEMTEVLLKLQGEFSAISGKDTRFDGDAVDEEKLRIDMKPIPRADWTPTELAVPKTEISVPTGISVSPVQTGGISVPRVPSGTLPELKPQPAEAMAGIPNIESRLNLEALQELPQARVQRMTCRVPEAAPLSLAGPAACSVEPIRVAIPKVPGIALGVKKK